MAMCTKQHLSNVLSNTLATFKAQFMKKSSDTEAELKKRVAYKKSVYSKFSKFSKMNCQMIREMNLAKKLLE